MSNSFKVIIAFIPAIIIFIALNILVPSRIEFTCVDGARTEYFDMQEFPWWQQLVWGMDGQAGMIIQGDMIFMRYKNKDGMSVLNLHQSPGVPVGSFSASHMLNIDLPRGHGHFEGPCMLSK